ncbi:hypothetical protein [Petrachloros mirabilis]|nr:hypothetical protein [Nitrospira sp.]
MRCLISGVLIVVVTFGEAAWGYEETMVSEGGTLLGAVTLDGQVPKPKGYNLITLPDQVYCGRISDSQGWQPLQPFNVGSAGQFLDVVVSLEGIEKGKTLTQTPTT